MSTLPLLSYILKSKNPLFDDAVSFFANVAGTARRAFAISAAEGPPNAGQSTAAYGLIPWVIRFGWVCRIFSQLRLSHVSAEGSDSYLACKCWGVKVGVGLVVRRSWWAVPMVSGSGHAYYPTALVELRLLVEV